MANWNSKELQTPPEIKQIAQNAQNAINNLDILLKLVKQGADVAKLFVLLINPAGAIIKIAANEIIKLCNDFKEIGVFYLFINPNDESYGNQTDREFGLAIQQDSNGLYQFEIGSFSLPPVNRIVNTEYRRTLAIADLSTDYLDSEKRNKNDPNFDPPIPILASPAQWELGGYNPETWTGDAPVYANIPIVNDFGETFGINPPQMKPSKVLRIMSEAFDDPGDVSTFRVLPQWKDIVRPNTKFAEIYTASGELVDKGTFNPDRLQSESLYFFPDQYIHHSDGPRYRTLEERQPITERVQSGKPNFSGSANIQGIEVLAVVAIVGVDNTSYKRFVEAFEALKNLFGNLPSISEFTDDISAIFQRATAPPDTPMTVTNDSKWGDFRVSTDQSPYYIIGQNSNAKAKITKIVKKEDYELKKVKETVLTLASGKTTIFKSTVDDNEDGRIQKLELLVKMIGEETFFPDEQIFEGITTPDIIVEAGASGETKVPGSIIVKPAKGSALDRTVPYDQVNPDDVASYGKVLGVNTAAPDSIHPDFESIKLKDVIPGYSDFFDEIIQFAEGLKGFAATSDEFIARIIKLIDETVEQFEEIASKIKAFLKIFADGLPAAGVYWLTIKTFGGNQAIQEALTSSENPPPDTLTYSAGFIMVSVSGMGGLSATKGFEKFFKGLGLEFQEVASIPDVSELDAAVQKLSDDYGKATAAQAELATDVFDAAGLNPPVTFRDATTIQFTEWNNVKPNVGDYVLGMKSGCFGQILRFDDLGSLVVDHIKLGPTITGTTVDEERIVRQYDNSSGQFIEFPYDGSAPLEPDRETSTGQDPELAIDFTKGNTTTLVGEGRFTKEVLTNRSSHKPNGKGTTVYEVFQGNENTFAAVEDSIEQIEGDNFDWTMTADAPFNTFPSERSMQQQIFKVIDGAVKDPELNAGFNGRFGFFTGDDTIISFTETTSRSSEELAQIFIADVEGRNTEEDGVTRLQIPPTDDDTEYKKMVITVKGDDAITETGQGGIVESYAKALDNVPNPENLPADRNLLEDN